MSLATPGPPSIPAVENIGATWARVCWDAPMMADSPISRYQIIAREIGGAGIVTENTTTNATMFNITGLLPATTYSFTVVAISEGGDVIAISQEGPAFQDITGFTGVCVCVCVYICVYMHACVRTCMCAYMNLCITYAQCWVTYCTH